jgi:hypothetical protein
MNQNIASTVITDKVRVSTAIIYYPNEFFGDYYQYETWIFSKDERVKPVMKIYGTSGSSDNDRLINRATALHNRVSRILNRKLNK